MSLSPLSSLVNRAPVGEIVNPASETGTKRPMGSPKKKRIRVFFRAPGRALESRRSLAVNAKRQIPRHGARRLESVKDGRVSAEAAEKAFSPWCAPAR